MRTAYKVVVHAEPEGGYWAEVPELPGCFSQGETLDELRQNVTEAIACHVLKDKIQVSMEAADRGEVLSQEEVEAQMAQWIGGSP